MKKQILEEISHTPKNCTLIKNLTPKRTPCRSIYLCKCSICGKEFIRSSKTLTEGYDDCGCISNKNSNNIKVNDYFLKNLDRTSKAIFKMKLDVLKNKNLSRTFQILYIDGAPFNEYVAMSNYMSLSSLYRYKKQILMLWSELKNEIMEEQLNVHNKGN